MGQVPLDEWGRALQKAAMVRATSRKGAKEKQPANGGPARDLRDPPSLRAFKDDPVEGGRLLLQLRSRKAGQTHQIRFPNAFLLR